MNHPLDSFNCYDIVPGKVVSLEPNGALIDVGVAEPVSVPLEHLSLMEIESPEEVLQLNETREFLIGVDYYPSSNIMRCLSIRELEYQRARERIEQLQAEDITVYAKVFAACRSGVLVRVEGICSLISNIHLSTYKTNEELVGEILPLKIVSTENNLFVFSHRWALLDDKIEQQEIAEGSISSRMPYAPGDIVVGKVINIEAEGALIDIGTEKTAYIPLYEMLIPNFDSPEEVLRLNQTREFAIAIIRDGNNYTLSVSIREFERLISWQRVRQMEPENVTLYAKVVMINSSGALVRIDGLVGFIPKLHISRGKFKEDLVGEELSLKFLEIDEERNRLILSHRLSLGEDETQQQLKVGDIVVGKVRGIRHYGVLVELEDNISGLLAIAEISHTPVDTGDRRRRAFSDRIFKVNDEVTATILDLDLDRGCILLSTKYLEPQPGDMLKGNPQIVYEKAEEMAARYPKLRESKASLENRKS